MRRIPTVQCGAPWISPLYGDHSTPPRAETRVGLTGDAARTLLMDPPSGIPPVKPSASPRYGGGKGWIRLRSRLAPSCVDSLGTFTLTDIMQRTCSALGTMVAARLHWFCLGRAQTALCHAAKTARPSSNRECGEERGAATAKAARRDVTGEQATLPPYNSYPSSSESLPISVWPHLLVAMGLVVSSALGAWRCRVARLRRPFRASASNEYMKQKARNGYEGGCWPCMLAGGARRRPST